MNGLARLRQSMNGKKKPGKTDLKAMRAELDELKADFEKLVELMTTATKLISPLLRR